MMVSVPRNVKRGERGAPAASPTLIGVRSEQDRHGHAGAGSDPLYG